MAGDWDVENPWKPHLNEILTIFEDFKTWDTETFEEIEFHITPKNLVAENARPLNALTELFSCFLNPIIRCLTNKLIQHHNS